MRCWRLAVGTVLLLLVFAPMGSVRAQTDPSEWALLGPLGPNEITAIAPSPAWPDDGVLLAVRPPGVVRTRDGGVTWELATAPTPKVFTLKLTTGLGNRLAFAVASPDARSEERALYRSPDLGDSWQLVLPLSRQGEASLALSPDFGNDGLAYAMLDGQLLRSRDAGESWAPVDPSSGQHVQDIAFSPAFAADRTIFLAVTQGALPIARGGPRRDASTTANEQSVGVMVSTDGGESWTLAGGGLEADGTAFRQIEWLAISPTFDRDGVVFAFGWGPHFENLAQREYGWQKALFRSHDRGVSWKLVQTFRNAGALVVALSPSFADDGVVLRGISVQGSTPASSTCRVERSVDGGQTWAPVLREGSYEGCGDLRLVGPRDGLTGVVLKGHDWYRSVDGGQTWAGLAPPTYTGSTAPMVVAPSPEYDRDRTLLVGSGHGGVWAVGPGVQATNGRLPCAAEVVGGFARVIESELNTRARLGCPLEGEHPSRIHVRRVGMARAVWTTDDPYWYLLDDTPPDRTGSFGTRVKAREPVPEAADEEIDGAVQHFEGGVLYFLSRADGRRSILVLTSRWHEVPD